MKKIFVFIIITLFSFVLKGTNDNIRNINDSIIYFDDNFYTKNYDKYLLGSQVCNYNELKKRGKSKLDLNTLVSDSSSVFNETRIDLAYILPFEEGNIMLKRIHRIENNEIDTQKEKKTFFDDMAMLPKRSFFSNIVMLPGVDINYSTINDFSVDIGLMIGGESRGGGAGNEYYGLKFTESFGRLKTKSAIGYHHVIFSLLGFAGIGSDIVHFYDYDTKQHEFGLEVSLNFQFSFNFGITTKSGFYFEVGI